MSALSEIQRIDNDRKELRKKQLIGSIIEDSVLMKKVKQERQKARDFGQQTQKVRQRVQHYGSRKISPITSIGGKVLGELPGARDTKGVGAAPKIKRSKTERGDTGAVKTKSFMETGPSGARQLSKTQSFTTSGYMALSGDPDFQFGQTSEARRKARKRKFLGLVSQSGPTRQTDTIGIQTQKEQLGDTYGR